MATTPDARPSRPSRGEGGLQALGVPVDGGEVYDVALTHRSFAFENMGDGDPRHNERLEFLGDAILGAVVTDLIFDSYPELAEGEMARLRASVVNTQALADLARSLDLGPHLRLGKGEEASGGRDKPSILADTFEAIVGAVYVDRGIDAVRASLEPLFEDLLQASRQGDPFDPKTLLQEVIARGRGTFPSYRVTSTGPDHDKRFEANVMVDGEIFGTGSGRSKKEAEQNAAREALARVESASDRVPEGDDDARAS